MVEEDEHIAIARRGLDEAITRLSEKLAELSDNGQKQSPSLTSLVKLQPRANSDDGEDGSAVVNQLISVSLDSYSRTGSADKSTRRLRDKVATFVSSLLPLTSVALGVVGKAFDASLMGVPISAITNGACFLVDVAIKERDRKELLLAELDRITYQARRVHEMQRYPDTILLPLLRERSLNLLTAIAWFLTGAIEYLARSFTSRIAKSVFKGVDVWQTRTSQLHLACEEYDQALLLQVASELLKRSLSHQAQGNLVAAAAAADDDEDAKIRGWLQPSLAENESKRMATLQQRAEGTLKWVLDLTELKAWRLAENPGRATTLWLTGLPGVGKSCIAAYICSLLPAQYPDDVVLNFFCKRDAARLSSAVDIVRTLCYQLTRSQDDFYRRFLREAPDLPKGNGHSKDDLCFFVDRLLKKPIISAGPKNRTIFIVLDGLDELLEDSSPTAAAGGSGSTAKIDVEVLLEQLVTLPQVKILVTSRPLPELDTILAAGPGRTVRQIGSRDNAEDIESYVAYRVARSSKLHQGFSSLHVDPVRFFTSRANGIFLWVSMVLDVLERGPNSLSAFKQSLDEIPPTMSSIYDGVFQRARQRGSLDLIVQVLHWVTVLPTPFTVQLMRVAVEISTGDKVLSMEDFLRTECGSFLSLLPRPGTVRDTAPSEERLEIHIGHETFQAWLLAGSRLGSEGRQVSHAKAATACLNCIVSGDAKPDWRCLKAYALERWRWHLRCSMGLSGDRQFAEPQSVLEGGSAISTPGTVAASLFRQLYLFLTAASGEWIKQLVEGEHVTHDDLFWEVHHTCIEVAAWCSVNKNAITDAALDDLDLETAELGRLKTWRDALHNPQVTARMLWPSVCRAWLWSTSPRWRVLYRCVEVLHRLYIYTHGEGLFEERPETVQLLREEGRVAELNAASRASGHGVTTSGQLHGTLTVHFANTILRAKELEEGDPNPEAAYACLESVKAAGRFDDLSGVCAANISVFFYEMWNRDRVVAASENPLGMALEAIQEAIDDDPDAWPRNYYHLGKVYSSMAGPYYPGERHDKEEYEKKSLGAYRDAVSRDPDHMTDARREVYQAEEDHLREQDPPALDAAVELLERAIADDPANSGSRWYHHLFDIHKQRYVAVSHLLLSVALPPPPFFSFFLYASLWYTNPGIKR